MMCKVCLLKPLVVYVSKTGNTKKVAESIARGLNCEAKDVTGHPDLVGHDLIGLGSGVYFSNPAKELKDFISEINPMNQKTFVFVTYGSRWRSTVESLKKMLSERGFEVIGDFKPRGLDKYGPLKIIGGINKGRPNEKDLKEAEEFAKSLLSRV
jgi:flavodoxin